MNHQQICTWVGIADATWPPDHYHLLGLEVGEPNIERIEEQVHGRLEAVRRYQLTNPDLATEAMNRLAQAFVCVTDPAAKQAYDTELRGEAASGAVAVEESPAGLAWLQGASEELVPLDDQAEAVEDESAVPSSQPYNPTKLGELPLAPPPADLPIPQVLPPAPTALLALHTV